jgi:hypothetical protein
MSLTCPYCRTATPAGSRFCIVCGRVLAGGASPRTAARSATGPTIRLGQKQAAKARGALSPRDGIPLVGLLFGTLFLIGVAQLIAIGGPRGVGLWSVVVLVAGALIAECAWVNGETWSGLRGMLLWGGATWLLAADRIFPWGLLLIPIWLMLWLHEHGKRP